MKIQCPLFFCVAPYLSLEKKEFFKQIFDGSCFHFKVRIGISWEREISVLFFHSEGGNRQDISYAIFFFNLLGSGRQQRQYPAPLPGKKQGLALLAGRWSSKRNSAGQPVPGGCSYRDLFTVQVRLSFFLSVSLPLEMMLFRYWFCRRWLLCRCRWMLSQTALLNQWAFCKVHQLCF